jgi:hypothetical protein
MLVRTGRRDAAGVAAGRPAQRCREQDYERNDCDGGDVHWFSSLSCEFNISVDELPGAARGGGRYRCCPLCSGLDPGSGKSVSLCKSCWPSCGSPTAAVFERWPSCPRMVVLPECWLGVGGWSSSTAPFWTSASDSVSCADALGRWSNAAPGVEVSMPDCMPDVVGWVVLGENPGLRTAIFSGL